VLKVSEINRNTRKHHFGSNGLDYMLHNCGTPRYCIRVRNTSFLLLPAEGLRNAPKHFQTSFWVQWTRMDASQVWYPEIVHSGKNTSFASFYVLKVSEIIRNTPKHHFVSNGLNGCFTTLVPEDQERPGGRWMTAPQ
jgi:hypothetical protein